MARVNINCVSVLLILISFGANAAPSRQKRTPTFGIAGAAAGAILGVPAAILAAPAVALGEARYVPGNAAGFGDPVDNGPGFESRFSGPSYGGPVNSGPVFGGPGYGSGSGLPSVSYSSSNSFSIGGGNAQSSASSSASSSAGGYGK